LTPPYKPRKRAGKAPADPLISFCRALPGATEDVKWGNDLIFSVGGKMFAGMPLPDCEPVSFKVDPVVFDTMAGHNGVVPAPYMARHHWLSVTDRKKMPLATLQGLIAESHRLVAEKLPRKTRQTLGL
jgi:predicted DNA-binding protein (MmcQ/YjbR family)